MLCALYITVAWLANCLPSPLQEERMQHEHKLANWMRLYSRVMVGVSMGVV